MQQIFYQKRINCSENQCREVRKMVSEVTNKQKSIKNVEIDLNGCREDDPKILSHLFN